MISVRVPESFLEEMPSGLIHIAEHLMFSGTKKLKRGKLKEQIYLYFNKLEAQTGRNYVRVFCYFDKKDIDVVLETLHQMLFSWHCAPQDFQEERADFVSEIEEYQGSFAQRKRRAFAHFIPELGSDVIGNLHDIKRTTATDLPRLEKNWQRMMAVSERRALVITGTLTAKDQRKIQSLFCSQEPLEKQTYKVQGTELQMTKDAAVFSVQSSASHLNFLLWSTILQWRCYDEGEGIESQFFATGGKQVLGVFSANGAINQAVVNRFFKKCISKKEFAFSKTQFLSYMRRALDVVDVTESLDWFEGFMDGDYAPLYTNDPRKIYRYFDRLTYEAFDRWVTRLISGKV